MLFASAWDHANRPSRAGNEPTVLLVGQLRCRASFRSILEGRGYQVFDAAAAGDGVGIARKLRPDLVIVEVGAGEGGGWDTIRALKGSAETYLIPVVAVSLATLPAGTYRRARSAGFVDYISRPLERRHVVEVVSTWTRARETLLV